MEGIAWEEWSDAAFKKAREQGKPILLALTAKWCHWCHVMDHTTYSDPEIIGLINSRYVPIRVDIDRRPDITARYNFGGYPTAALLTKDGNILAGGTYVPPDEMKRLLSEVYEKYKSDLAGVERRIEEFKEKKSRESIVAAKAELDASMLREIILYLEDDYDPVFGGFGVQPKFPHPGAIELLLLRYRDAGKKEHLAMVTKTLDEMIKGRIWDGVEGGFFRYSVARDWSVPHYEKMLETNSKLMKNYLETYRATDDKRYKDTVLEIAKYLEAVLYDEERGVFYANQDADEEYYALDMAGRKRRKAPSVDKTIFSNLNAQVASAYIYAYEALGNEEYLRTALRTLDFLLENAYEKGVGVHHFFEDGQRRLPGLLVDQVHVAGCSLRAYEATGSEKYLVRAEELMNLALERLYDEDSGVFLDAPIDTNPLGKLREPVKSMEENSLAARVLLRLNHITGEEKYREKARAILKGFAREYPGFGFLAYEYGLALSEFFGGSIVITASGPEKELPRLLKAAASIYEPRKIVKAQIGEGEPMFLLCSAQVCSLPARDAKELKVAVEELARISKG